MALVYEVEADGISKVRVYGRLGTLTRNASKEFGLDAFTFTAITIPCEQWLKDSRLSADE